MTPRKGHGRAAASWSTVATRASIHERQAWAKAARAAGKSLSSWVRDVCNAAAMGVPIRTDVERDHDRAEIRRLDVELARALHELERRKAG